MSRLSTGDLEKVVANLPGPVKALLESRADLMVAGGFIRATVAGEPIKDVDIFGPTEQALTAGSVFVDPTLRSRLHHSENAISVWLAGNLQVQFITRWTFDTPKAALDSFDFTICQAVVWHETDGWKSLVGPLFYRDIFSKTLTYLAPAREEDSAGSLMRVIRFAQRGYGIKPGSLSAVIARIVGAALKRDEADVLLSIDREMRICAQGRGGS